jgi:hypothetical protein
MTDPDALARVGSPQAIVLGLLAAVSLAGLGALTRSKVRGLRFHPAEETEPPLWSGLDVVVALVLYLLLMVLFQGLVAAALGASQDDASPGTPLVFLGAGGVTFLYVSLTVRGKLGQSMRTLGLQAASRRNLVPSLALYVMAFLPIVAVAELWRFVLEVLEWSVDRQPPVKTYAKAIAEGDPLTIAGLVLTGVALAPFFEEMLFRGLLFGLLRRRWGFGPGMVASGALFALYHFNLLALVPLFVVGALLAVVYEKTRSLWWAMLWHGVFNGVNLLLMATGVGV